MSTPRHLIAPSVHAHRRGLRQQGVALLFALLTLVALMLATLALVRSVDTSTMLLGNIAFKQDATAAADQASRLAIQQLKDLDLTVNDATKGYYASTQEIDAAGAGKPPLDATGKQMPDNVNRQLVDWDDDRCDYATAGSYTGCTVKAADAGTINGNTARYVIFRLCSKPGDQSADTTISCARPLSSAKVTASGRGEINYTEPTRFVSTSGVYYRVVVRVLGARNTTSFTETIVHF